MVFPNQQVSAIRALALLVCVSVGQYPADAGTGCDTRANLRGSLGSEGQYFHEAPIVEGQYRYQETYNLEAELDVNLPTCLDIRLHPRMRVDGRHPKANPLVMDDMFLGWHGTYFEGRAGYQVFSWKVVESYTQADILNQTDLRFDLLNPEKLAEPSLFLLLRLPESLGESLEGYLLPYFTPAPLPRDESRYNPAAGSPFRVKAETAELQYDSHRKRWEPQGAIRYNFRPGMFNASLYYFQGYSRFPSFVLSATDAGKLVPLYRLYHQGGVTFQGPMGNWLWKMESAYRRSVRPILNGLGTRVEPYWSVTAGLEYTFFSALLQDQDLMALIELLGDSDSGEDPARIDGFRPFQNDIFAGMRYVFNGLSDASLTAGMYWDWKTDEIFYRLQFQTRVFTSFTVNGGYNGIRIKKGNDPQVRFLKNSSNGFLGLKYYW